MKIILIGPKTVKGKEYDGIIWNFLMPLENLGHEVFFLNTERPENNERLTQLVEEQQPDIIFSILTGSGLYEEPLERIEYYTNNSNIITCNWFCDDSWRFDNYSSKICDKFNAIVTTEESCIQKYNDLGMNNAICLNWHANASIYSVDVHDQKTKKVSFVGALYPERREYIEALINNGIEVHTYGTLTFSEMIDVMNDSLICLNFSKNPNDPERKTQMKLRPFEIAACKSLVVTEDHDSMEKYFIPNKEAIYFTDIDTCVNKVKKLLDKERVAAKIAEQGHKRFLNEHTSKHRMKALLEFLNNENN